MMSVLKLIYKYNAIPIKIPMSTYVELEKLNLKFIWKNKHPIIARKTVKNKTKNRTLKDE